MKGIIFLLVNGTFTFFLFRFIERMEDPIYAEKMFSLMIGGKRGKK